MTQHTQRAAPGRRTDSGGSLHRITVNLTPRAWEALGRAVKLTGDSKTDTLNRAVQVYAYLMNIIENDGDVFVRDAGHDELERLLVV
jgi:hypothetical protein